MISAREMLGAMLRMKREQVLCRGRGLHSSPGASLGFSRSSSLGFSFSLTASSMQKAVVVSENLLLTQSGGGETLSNLPPTIKPSSLPQKATLPSISPTSPPSQPCSAERDWTKAEKECLPASSFSSPLPHPASSANHINILACTAAKDKSLPPDFSSKRLRQTPK